MTPFPGQSEENALSAQLAESDHALGTLAPALRQLLAHEGHFLFDEELLARIRGMLADVARQLLVFAAKARDAGDTFVDRHADAVAAGLAEDDEMLRHVEALAVEGRLCERVRESGGPDPALPPLLQALIRSDDAENAAVAQAFLAAQARFLQNLQRMELPLSELPTPLLVRACAIMRDRLAPEIADEALRVAIDEEASRIGLASRLVRGIGGGATPALSIEHAGVTIFLAALSFGSGLPRDVAVLSTADGQQVRLALALAAAGLEPSLVKAQMLALNPDAPLPAAIEGIDADIAARLLSASGDIGA